MRFRIPAALFGISFVIPALADASATREDLLLAYREDVSEHARYLAYAEQAEREQERYVARLFRATAEAERVRAERHARALRRLGEEPIAAAAPVEVDGTRANLLRALAHESAELNRGYAQVEQARDAGDADAELSFVLARAAHESLVRLYQDAVRDPHREARAGDVLYVCQTCGHIVRGREPDRCPVSLSSADTFTRVD